MARPPNTRALIAFRHTIMNGSVTGAANVLGRTQPAISRLLKELEADAGFALFERVKGRLIPTAEGRLFFEELQRSFLDLECTVTVAAEIRQGRHGSLLIAALPAAAASFLPCKTACKFFQTLECAPRGGQFQATILTSTGRVDLRTTRG